MTPASELGLLLVPAGGGVYVVSTGRAAQLGMQKRLYGVRGGPTEEAEIEARFRESLEQVKTARVLVLGIPSDVGAGYVRGANLGPQEIRARLLEDDPTWPDRMRALGVVDVGDVLVVPQLLHDDMLTEDQKRRTRDATYPNVRGRQSLPVSPLSRAERVLDLALSINPRAAPFVLGGDHSCAWPAVSALSRHHEKGTWGIVQIDAHTDLLEERLGIRICFATWSWHANELLGRGERLVQVGIRATRHDRGHWEKTLGVRQFWADECLRDPSKTVDAIVAQVEKTGVRGVYFSNDIDGTDERWADATGTPEPNGLEPDFVVDLIRRLSKKVPLIGGDIMEVAPPLQRRENGARTTLGVAARYVRETIEGITSRENSAPQ